MQSAKPHAVLFASPGMGHLIPVIELGRTLVDLHNFEATIFVLAADSSVAESQLLKSPNPDKLHIVSLPPVDLSSLIDPAAPLGAKLVLSMRESVPNLRSAILSMKFRPTILIVDLFGTEAFAIADELKMLKYVFMTAGAWFLAVIIHMPHLDVKAKDDHIIHHEPLRIPGCESVRYEDTLEIFDQDPTGEAYADVCRMSREMQRADGILINTFEDLEPISLKALRDTKIFGGSSNIVPVYPIGPLVREAGPSVQVNKVLSWLDSQPPKSVVYVSFGSGGALSAQQLKELAWGLELTQQRFIWVVRPPVENDASGSYFDIGNKQDDTPDYLPGGFMARTQKRGLVVPMWAPQAQILTHPSIGAFVSHCGWNSTLESIINAVPLIAWPLYAEQKMNAVALAEQLGVAVRCRPPSNGVVGREEISKIVRRIMADKEGESIRNRVENLKNTAQKASSKGGSSYSSLSEFAHDCEMNLQCLKGMAQGA